MKYIKKETRLLLLIQCSNCYYFIVYRRRFVEDIVFIPYNYIDRAILKKHLLSTKTFQEIGYAIAPDIEACTILGEMGIPCRWGSSYLEKTMGSREYRVLCSYCSRLRELYLYGTVLKTRTLI